MQKKINSSFVFQFKITLNSSQPKIWRRILVPADYSFFDLHCAIQNAMGWADGHLHAFYIEEGRGRNRFTIAFPNPEGEDAYHEEARDERKKMITDYFNNIIKQCIHCYDFGDSWDHTILWERALPKKEGVRYPLCIAGARACPPEDCGGLGGYEDLQNILNDLKHPEHLEMLEWLGIDDAREFQPDVFNPTEVEFENPKQRLMEYERGFGI